MTKSVRKKRLYNGSAKTNKPVHCVLSSQNSVEHIAFDTLGASTVPFGFSCRGCIMRQAKIHDWAGGVPPKIDRPSPSIWSSLADLEPRQETRRCASGLL